jgi:hypothetical protein
MLTTALLIAQLGAPYCGWNYGVEITPQNAPFTGCYVPPPAGRQLGGAILREDPLSPGGVRSYPARGEWQTF